MGFELVSTFVLLFLMISNSAGAQAVTIDNFATPESMRWLFSQGGLLVAFLVMAWSYRRDLIRGAEEKKESAERAKDEAKEEAAERSKEKNLQIDALIKIVETGNDRYTQMTAIQAQTTAAVQALVGIVGQRAHGGNA